MATLEKIRQRGVLLSIVIGVSMLLFIIGMIDVNSITGASAQKVAEVNGTEINIADYERRIDEMTAFYKIESGQNSLPDQYAEQIRESVWNTSLKEIVLGEQCAKLGLVVTDKEVADNLTGDNPHPMMSQLRMFYNQEKGGFDKAVLYQLLDAVDEDPASDAAKYWSFVQRSVRNQLLEDKYTALTGASISINELDAKYFFNASKSAEVSFTSTPYSTIADSTVTVSSSEQKSYYKEHKNEFWREKENRSIIYLAYNIEPSESDYEDIKAWIEDLKNEFFTSDDYIAICNQNSDESYSGIATSRAATDKDLADFAFSGKTGDTFGPQLFGDTYKMARVVESGISASDSAKVRHILVMESTAAKTQQCADSVVNLLNSGADFAAVAKSVSKAGTASNGGELGWLRDGDYDKEFSSACINATVGKVFTLPMGGAIQVIEVTEKTQPVDKVKLCVLKRKVEASSQTYANIFNEASQYMAQNNELEEFQKAADPSKGEFLRNYTIAATDNKIADLKDSRQIIRWAFDAKVGEVADKVFECGDKFVVAALQKVSEAGYPDLSEVADEVNAAVKKDKKAEIIKAELDSKLLSGDLSATGSVNAAQKVSFTSNYVNGIGVEPVLYATVSTMTPDSKPAVVKGSNGVYAVKVLSEEAPSGTFVAETEIKNLENRRPYRYMVYKSLEEAADIRDNRISLY